MALALVVSLLVTASVEELCFFSESVPSVGTSAPQMLRLVWGIGVPDIILGRDIERAMFLGVKVQAGMLQF